MAYREYGNGDKNILLVHGNMCSGVHFLPLVKRLPPNFKAYIVDLRGFGDSTYNNKIDNIKAPVLSFWGENDIIIPEDMVRETVKALGDKAELVILKNSGHSPLIDCPDVLIQNIIDFVI